MKTCIIPFDGFYESITMSLLEPDLDSENQNQREEGLPEIIDWEVIDCGFYNVAKEWVKSYRNWLESEFNLKLESLQFESLSSPREYNFTTDRIFCNISDEDIVKLHEFALKHHLDHATVQDAFASRDGFHSFYDDFVNEWSNKPVLDWDHNELTILFPTSDSEGEDFNYYDIWEDSLCNGFFFTQIEFIYKED